MYKLTNLENQIQRLLDGALIPFDPANTDYREYLIWLDDGNEPESADPVPVVIPSINAAQIRLQLTAMGLRDTVESAVAEGSQDLKDKWNFSPRFIVADPDIQAMASQLHITEDDLNQLFIDASKL